MNGCADNQKISLNEDHIRSTIIALETQALELWNKGNPDGFLQLSSDEVVYIDPFFAHKLEGIDQLRDYYNTMRGKIKVDKYEIVSPVVQSTSDIAVLTYNLISESEDTVYKWNCTEVYQLNSLMKWQIIHTHWSLYNPN